MLKSNTLALEPNSTYAKSQLIGKDPDAGKDGRHKENGRWRTRWLGNIADSMDMNLSKLQTTAEDRGAWRAAVHGVSKNQTWLSDWTTTNLILLKKSELQNKP